MNKAILTRLAIFGVSALAAPWAVGQNDTQERTQERIDNTKQAVSDYVFLRQQIAETKNEWRVYRDVTERRIDFFKEEIARLEGEIAQLEETRSSAQQVIEEKRQQINKLEQANATVLEAMPELEAKLQALIEYFPAPLKQTVSPLVDQLGAANQAAQRMAVVIGIMNEVDRFNAEWQDSSEQVGNSLVNVLYMGLGGGFYANSEGTVGGYLIPAKGGWERVEDNSIAAQVAMATKYYNDEVTPAQLVPVPLQVRDLSIGQ